MKSPMKVASGLKLQRQLYTMKKYIYNYLIRLPNDKKNNQIKQYIDYLKKEIENAEKLMEDNGNFEINYLFSLFSKGIEVNFDYDDFECVYYNNEKGKNSILGKALLPQIDFNFKLTNSLIYVKFFDFEFEINDLTNTKLFLNTLMKITEEKLKSVKIFIEPCLIQMKSEIEKNENKNNNNSNNNNDLNNYDTFRNLGIENNTKSKLIEDKRGITKTLQENESMENGVNFINKDDENINGLGIKL
jgi:paraquat-inducible protein B